MQIYQITPVPKPRMTRRDRWAKRPCVMRYWAFADQCKALGVKLSADGDSVTFVLPMPKSWPKKKQEAMKGKPHQQKPDISNLLKALEDATNVDDSHIWHYSGLKKIWGDAGQIIIGNLK